MNLPMLLSYVIFSHHYGSVRDIDLGALFLLIIGLVLACGIVGYVIKLWQPDPFMMKIAMTIIAVFCLLVVIDFFF